MPMPSHYEYVIKRLQDRINKLKVSFTTPLPNAVIRVAE